MAMRRPVAVNRSWPHHSVGGLPPHRCCALFHHAQTSVRKQQLFIKCAAVHHTISKGAEVTRSLKPHLPQHTDDLEAIAENFDGIGEDFSECRRVLERLNAGPA